MTKSAYSVAKSVDFAAKAVCFVAAVAEAQEAAAVAVMVAAAEDATNKSSNSTIA